MRTIINVKKIASTHKIIVNEQQKLVDERFSRIRKKVEAEREQWRKKGINPDNRPNMATVDYSRLYGDLV